jgi:hypothetical protein
MEHGPLARAAELDDCIILQANALKTKLLGWNATVACEYSLHELRPYNCRRH